VILSNAGYDVKCNKTSQRLRLRICGCPKSSLWKV